MYRLSLGRARPYRRTPVCALFTGGPARLSRPLDRGNFGRQDDKWMSSRAAKDNMNARTRRRQTNRPPPMHQRRPTSRVSSRLTASGAASTAVVKPYLETPNRFRACCRGCVAWSECLSIGVCCAYLCCAASIPSSLVRHFNCTRLVLQSYHWSSSYDFRAKRRTVSISLLSFN